MPELIKLSILQARVYFCVKKCGPIGPTSLGIRLKYDYDNASQHMSRPLKYLVGQGLIKVERTNGRIVRYSVVHEIDPPFEIVGGTDAKELDYAD